MTLHQNKRLSKAARIRRGGLVALFGLVFLLTGCQSSRKALTPGEKPPPPDGWYRAVFVEPPTFPRLTTANAPTYIRVVLEFYIDSKGNVRNPRIAETTNEAFNKEILKAAKDWKLKPGLREGMPANVRVQMPMYFAVFPVRNPDSTGASGTPTQQKNPSAHT